MEEEIKQEATVKESKGLSIASMVLGLSGLILFALPCGVLAIIFSVLAKRKGKSGMATAGLVLGIIDAVFGLIAIIAAAKGVATFPSIF